MTFDEAFTVVSDTLMRTGTNITENDYDGIIVKKLEASNTLDYGRTTNQTHIAITGAQMDIFPYLRSDGYFNEQESDNDLKKYFITQIPINLYETNINYLDAGQTNISFNNGIKQTVTSVVRSKRKKQADQIQVSLINFDGEDFVAFRKFLHTGTYLIFLKKSCVFEYDCFGIIPGRKIDGDGELQKLNNNFYKKATKTTVNVASLGKRRVNEEKRLTVGANILLYGVPGSGKSWTIEHEYCKKETNIERLVFHPDYTYSDFIGQILPNVDEEGQVSYKFTAGPFTNILADAYAHPQEEYILIIEEINRGNAPAIFGDVFQLLDRLVESKTIDGTHYPRGTSEYGITNPNIAKIVYGDEKHKVRIPSNLSILGTMNTSDQNVFTLDTAFQRRWNMRLIENTFDNVRNSLAEAEILDTGVKWREFCLEINKLILSNKNKMVSAEDKRLGVYFINESDLSFDKNGLPSKEYTTLTDEINALNEKEREKDISSDEKERLNAIRKAVIQNRIFPEKVIKYLWDDAFKFNPEAIFDTEKIESLEQIIRVFVYDNVDKYRLKIFKPTLRQALCPTEQ